MAMAQEFEFEPWPPDGVGKSGRLIRQPGPRAVRVPIDRTLRRPRIPSKTDRLCPLAGHWAKCRPVGGLAFGDRIAECQGTKNPQDKSFRPKDRTGVAT